MARITIPFGSGVREDVDPLVMPQGALKRVENLRLTREGRLALRKGYTALALTTPNSGGVTSFTPTDLAQYGDRLLAFGCSSALATPAPRDIYEFVNQAQFKWRPTDEDLEPRLCPVTGLRTVGRMPSQTESTATGDIAAGGGLVCIAWQTVATGVTVHIFDPATDSTVLWENFSTMSRPRLMAVGSVFFLTGIVAATVALYRFDKSTDSALVQLTDVFATAAAAISYHDASLNEAGTGFAVAIARNATPAVTIKFCNSSGAVTTTITGPAVSVSRMAVLQQAARVHLVVQESSDDHADLYTYTAAGALENTTTDLAGGVAMSRQPGICVTGTQSDLLIQLGVSGTVYQVRLDPSTHGTFSDRSWLNVIANTKPATTPQSEVFACAHSDTSSSSTAGLATLLGIVGRAQTNATEMLGCAKSKGLGLNAFQSHLSHIAKDVSTGKFYWLEFVQNALNAGVPLVNEVLIDDTGRRQTAVVDNALYIAAAMPQIFAGRQIVEACFPQRPVITSATPSNSTGSLTSNTLYQVAVTFEWYDEQDRFHTSDLSTVEAVTMGASDDTITVVVQGPLTVRCNATNQLYGGAVTIVLWRSLAAPDKQLHRATTSTVTPGTFGASVTLVTGQSDASLEDEAIIYTQGASGARSGPNPFVSPQPCRYLYPSGDKITSGGLPQDSQIQESRSAFPNEPITWAENLGGLSSAPERVLAVARLDERRIAWTARGIFEWGGEGLDINGVGDLGFARRLPSPGGLYGGADGWRSLCETAMGIFFQLAADALYLLPRGGGAPVFIGKAVQDTLAAYPTITSATYLKTEQVVCFTCNNLAGDDSVILVFDLESQQWVVDTDTSTLLASCEYQGRLVILRGNRTIELQDASHPPSTFLTALIETGTLYPAGQGGDVQIEEIQLFAEFRGACNVICSLSYDDGQSYTALTTKALTGLTVGSTVTIKWGPNNMRGDRVRLKFHTTDLSGASEQLAFQFATVDFTAHGRSALRTTTQKG